MKRCFLIIAVLASMASTASAQRHIEFKWHGFYSVVDFSFGTNVNRASSQTEEEPDAQPAARGLATKDANDMRSEGYSVNAFSTSVSAGFQFRKEAGIGVGVCYFVDPTGAFTQVPVFVELRTHILRSRITPYCAVQAGYSSPVGTSSEPPRVEITKGGFYFGLEAGARYAVNRTFAVGAHLGYRLLQPREVSSWDIDNVPMIAEPVALHMLGGGITLHF